MAESAPAPNAASTLEALLETTNAALIESLLTQTGVELRATDGEIVCLQPSDVLERVDGEITIARAALGGEFDGRSLRVILASRETATIAGHVQSLDDAEIETNREAGKLEGGSLAEFEGIACTLFEALASKLGGSLDAECSVAPDGHGTLALDGEPEGWLGTDELVAYRTKFQIGDAPTSEMWLCIDRATAEAWNGAPFDSGSNEPEPIPTRGTISCYLADAEPYNLVRRACRRSGLDTDHRPSSEVPNPAAYRGKLVLIDIPVRSDRRFDWCRRLKDYDPTCRVVLMLRQPSRQRVVQGFLARADVIVGWPLEEEELTAKLNEAFDKLGQPLSPDPVAD